MEILDFWYQHKYKDDIIIVDCSNLIPATFETFIQWIIAR